MLRAGNLGACLSLALLGACGSQPPQRSRWEQALIRPGAVRPLGMPLQIQVALGLDALPVG
jgi:hypothetical protein